MDRSSEPFTEQVTRQAMESIQQAVGALAPRRPNHRGNGTAPPTVVAAAAASRLDGLDVRPDAPDPTPPCFRVCSRRGRSGRAGGVSPLSGERRPSKTGG